MRKANYKIFDLADYTEPEYAESNFRDDIRRFLTNLDKKDVIGITGVEKVVIWYWVTTDWD